MLVLGMIGTLVSIAMGAAGVGIIRFINERRTTGKSELEWTLTAGAVTGGLSILLSLAFIFLLFAMVSSGPGSLNLNVGMRFAFEIPVILLGDVLPLAMIALLLFKGKLD